MDLRKEFIYWYFEEFQEEYMYTQMRKVTEGSPYHRERNVAVHNDMVVTNYVSFIGVEWEFEHLLGAFATAFHDVGKPHSMEICHNEERGEYKRFNGHETRSACMWANWACVEWEMLHERFGFRPQDIYTVQWMIEKHLPWRIKDRKKREMLALTTMKTMGTEVPYVYMLMADAMGRICDDDKEMESAIWCNEFVTFTEDVWLEHRMRKDTPNIIDNPTMYIMVGPSGVGKTTWANALSVPHETYSWDSLRLQLYTTEEELDTLSTVELYRLAFSRQVEDPDFNKKSTKAFVEMVKRQPNIVVDNTSLSAKRRKFFIEEGRRHGYRLIGVYFPVALSTVANRQISRTDKNVPLDAVERQYNHLQVPQYGEFDEVLVIGDNLPK